jgi:hypothetical protein
MKSLALHTRIVNVASQSDFRRVPGRINVASFIYMLKRENKFAHKFPIA